MLKVSRRPRCMEPRPTVCSVCIRVLTTSKGSTMAQNCKTESQTKKSVRAARHKLDVINSREGTPMDFGFTSGNQMEFIEIASDHGSSKMALDDFITRPICTLRDELITEFKPLYEKSCSPSKSQVAAKETIDLDHTLIGESIGQPESLTTMPATPPLTIPVVPSTAISFMV